MKVENKTKEYEGKVLALDFDGTITSEEFHSHNHLMQKKCVPITGGDGLIVNGDTGLLKLAKNYNPIKIAQDCVEYLELNTEALRNPEQLLIKSREFVQKGAQIAIVSFNLYPVVIDVVLKKIGFTEIEVENMNIILGFPLGKKELVGKNEHLAKLKELTAAKNNKDIILIDDDITNCSKAKMQGYQSLHVKVDNYIGELERVLDESSNIKESNIMGSSSFRGSGGYTNLCDSLEEDDLDDIKGENMGSLNNNIILGNNWGDDD